MVRSLMLNIWNFDSKGTALWVVGLYVDTYIMSVFSFRNVLNCTLFGYILLTL